MVHFLIESTCLVSICANLTNTTVCQSGASEAITAFFYSMNLPNNYMLKEVLQSRMHCLLCWF